jgi:hypothetical protein
LSENAELRTDGGRLPLLECLPFSARSAFVMRRLLSTSLLCLAVGLSTGCAMCSNEHDYDYGFYGGSWQRSAPCEGRVGSAFYPAGGPVMPAPVEESILTPQNPTPTEETPPPGMEAAPGSEELPPQRRIPRIETGTEVSTPRPRPGTQANRRPSSRTTTMQKNSLP